MKKMMETTVTTMTIRTYSELRSLRTFVERFEYLSLRGTVGRSTFGHDRYINQLFYTSSQWRSVRKHIIARDLGCDLGIEGYEIHSNLVIHHVNPIDAASITNGDEDILDPEYLITTTQKTHNAIHYGDASILRMPREPRRPGDTKLW